MMKGLKFCEGQCLKEMELSDLPARQSQTTPQLPSRVGREHGEEGLGFSV